MLFIFLMHKLHLIYLVIDYLMAMFHRNKGIIGLKSDTIQNVIVKYLIMSDLYNACESYSIPGNGQVQVLEKKGFRSNDVICKHGESFTSGAITFGTRDLETGMIVYTCNNGQIDLTSHLNDSIMTFFFFFFLRRCKLKRKLITI